nr:unnamed protein product [Callosobruchus analis]CAI5838115.1 unnamed protein product [Callosobruchus analis]
MAVCDSDCRFRIIDVGAYGKDSDGGVLSSSKFYQEIKNGRCKLPAEEHFLTQILSLLCVPWR